MRITDIKDKPPPALELDTDIDVNMDITPRILGTCMHGYAVNVLAVKGML